MSAHDELTPLESNALKWVLLCQRYQYDPLTADVTYFEPRHLSAKLGIDPNHEHVHFAAESRPPPTDG